MDARQQRSALGDTRPRVTLLQSAKGRRTWIRLIAGFVVASAIVAAACGGGDDDSPPTDEPTAQASAASTPGVSSTEDPTNTEDWTLYTIPPVALSLPPDWVTGPPVQVSTFDAIRALGGGCVGLADLLQPAGASFSFIAVDPSTCSDASIHNIQLLRLPTSTDVVTPDDFGQTFLEDLPETAQVIDAIEAEIGDKPAAILTIRRAFGDRVTVQRIYAVRDEENQVWFAILAAANEADFGTAAPIYDAIANTMRLR